MKTLALVLMLAAGAVAQTPVVSVVRLCPAFAPPCSASPAIIYIATANEAVRAFEVTYRYSDSIGEHTVVTDVIARASRYPAPAGVSGAIVLTGNEAALVGTPTAKSLVYAIE